VHQRGQSRRDPGMKLSGVDVGVGVFRFMGQ
jgi:hypothetical protein